MEILSNILTSSVLIGFAILFMQRYMESKFRSIEDTQRFILSTQRDYYNIMLNTIQDIWGKIIETEFYIRHGLNKQLETAVNQGLTSYNFDFSPIKDAFIFIEKKSILLTPSVNEHLILFFTQYYQDTYNEYIQVINRAIKHEISLLELNKFIPNKLGLQYKADLSQLKRMLENEVKNVIK